ncbi:MAG: hypothetical protein ACD_45C00680G0006 [uncultured bacterium]|nr:MAG: hypothetical protein ACD_45C00680G0006 [uncultured bacterium]
MALVKQNPHLLRCYAIDKDSLKRPAEATPPQIAAMAGDCKQALLTDPAHKFFKIFTKSFSAKS